MSYEGEAFGMVTIPDVDLPGDVADWLIEQSAQFGQSPGEWIANLVTTYARRELAEQARKARKHLPGGGIRYYSYPNAEREA